MDINDYNSSNLLKRLPDLKLSYNITNKKVFSDLYIIIPTGKKHLVWFTYYEDKRVCLFIEISSDGRKRINKFFIVPQIFEKKLVLGTIFYGTLFSIGNSKYFSIENVNFYKGRNVENYNELNKLLLIKNILKNELKSSIINSHGICMALPVITNSFETAIESIKTLKYKVYCIQNRFLNKNNNSYNSTIYKDINGEQIIKTFIVKADIENDIYDLYYYSNNDLIKYDIAYISDYKTSIFMNNIFRTIKENKNLDALEESDDEDEFQNIENDKFVDLNKCVKMECEYNKKFNKYIPIKIAENNTVCRKKDFY
jgi:hypothetical protein